MTVRVQLQPQKTVLSIIADVEQCAISDVLRFGVERVALAIVGRRKWHEVIARAVHAIVQTRDQHRAQRVEDVFERFIPVQFVLEVVSNVRRLLQGEGSRAVASGDVVLTDVVEEGSDEAIEAKWGVIADGDGGESLWILFAYRDESLCWILEIRFDRFNDEVKHDAGVDDERNRPEDAILRALAACDARNTVRRRVQSEFTDDRATPSCVDLGLGRVATHRGHRICTFTGCFAHR